MHQPWNTATRWPFWITMLNLVGTVRRTTLLVSCESRCKTGLHGDWKCYCDGKTLNFFLLCMEWTSWLPQLSALMHGMV